jgi:hypothetical protein
MALTRYTVIQTVSAVYPPVQSEVINGPGAGAVTAPAFPATTVAVQNPNAFPVSAVITGNGATISAVIVNGTTVGIAAGTYVIPAAGSFSCTYTGGPPTWAWSATPGGPPALAGRDGDRVRPRHPSRAGPADRDRRREPGVLGRRHVNSWSCRASKLIPDMGQPPVRCGREGKPVRGCRLMGRVGWPAKKRR